MLSDRENFKSAGFLKKSHIGARFFLAEFALGKTKELKRKELEGELVHKI